MSYSCTDFTDSILEALAIVVPKEFYDSPSDQADLAIERIEQMQEALKQIAAYDRTGFCGNIARAALEPPKALPDADDEEAANG